MLLQPTSATSPESLVVQVLGGHCLAASQGDIIFTTVLGSCVSACLYDRRSGICGMNHFLLPTGGHRDPGEQDRFGDTAMMTLLEDMLSLGASLHTITARLYGGKRTMLAGKDIGALNAGVALQFLQDNRIPVTDTDLGGHATRWVRFHRATGRAFVKASGSVRASTGSALADARGRPHPLEHETSQM